MEPVTHFLTGACLARAGFNRKAAYATLAMTLAAEAPDIDVLWSFKGPIAAFQHHRGITHTLLGSPFEAALVLFVVWLYHRWLSRGSRSNQSSQDDAAAPRYRFRSAPPVRWPLLYAFILLALLSHLFLDWTNNYGLRPFFPFNPHWYAGSFVFIFEPVIFFFLLAGLVAPALFGLVNSEIGAKRPAFRGRGWAIAALTGVVLLWSLRFYEHAQALTLASAADYSAPVDPLSNADIVPPQILRAFASPLPLNPFRWATVVETPWAFEQGSADTLHSNLNFHHDSGTIPKPPTTINTLIAKRSWLGEAYLDWSSWPLVTDIGPDAHGNSTVTFDDLRFMYSTPLGDGRRNPPLSGSALIDPDRRILSMSMDHHIQH